MKDAGALGWADVGNREAALIGRCAAGDQSACAELVSGHERMVFQLALHLLGDRDEALDLSQDVFFSVFRTIHNFRGQSTLKTWIYRIVINQARNRQRWWRRRHKSEQVSLDQHVAAHGDLRQPGDDSSPDRAFARKQLAERLWAAPLKVWFPDGLDTRGLSLIKVHVDSAEYWESSSSKVRQLIGAALAAATGDPDKFPATNRSVNL